MKILLKIFNWFYHEQKCSLYSGKGYDQGMGFDLFSTEINVFGGKLKFLKDIKISEQLNWMRDLKKRWKSDDIQQKIERDNFKKTLKR